MPVEREPAPDIGVTQPYVMYLDQSAHLDWDWTQTFDGYYTQQCNDNRTVCGVSTILPAALASLESTSVPGAKPTYSICEMGFLHRFVEGDPQRAAEIAQAGDSFQVIGGGITSPDCLVCSGEGLIRNYLVGRLACAAVLPGVVPKPHCVIPDDFGQEPELPVLLQALGFEAVVISRVPTDAGPIPIDFVWKASDSSEVVGHWMLKHYGYANNGGGTVDIDDLVAQYDQGATTPGTYPAAATRFMYFAVEDDFTMPNAHLSQDIAAWNAGGQSGQTNVRAQAGTFDDFMRQVLVLRDSLPVRAPYNGTPYWTGYYASRPQLKILHYGALRALLECEVFGLLAGATLPDGYWSSVDQAWWEFAPSTHHDYVCGTAVDDVYLNEQLPRLTKAADAAAQLRTAALGALAGTARATGTQPIIVANGLGFERTDLAEVDVAVTSADGLQPSNEGGTLFMASVPSLGFVALDLASLGSGTQPAPAAIQPATSGASGYTLSNEYMTLVVGQAAGWGIASLVDRATGAQVLGGVGNALVFYSDPGDIYRFGNETDFGGQFEIAAGVKLAAGRAEILESGPLRVRLRTTVTATPPPDGRGGQPTTFTREYALVAGERFVRLTTTGAAFAVGDDAPGYSVMARFPLVAPVTRMSHGTGGHWTDEQPLPGRWPGPVFRATHDFLVAQGAQAQTLAAMYHDGMPAWAYDGAGALLGCLLRNTPGGTYGASGTDVDAHTQRYALRVPSGFPGPSTGQPLREARRFNTPLHAVPVAPAGAGTLGSGSIAKVAAPAILTVAKPGSLDRSSLVLRFYQPTNEYVEVRVTPGSPLGTRKPEAVTALEGPWQGPRMDIASDEAGFRLGMPAAIATVRIS